MIFPFRTNKRSHRRCSLKKDVLGNFAKFTGKHLCQSIFFNVAGLRPATLLKNMLWHRCFPVNLFQNFQEHLFYRPPLDDCFWTKLLLAIGELLNFHKLFYCGFYSLFSREELRVVLQQKNSKYICMCNVASTYVWKKKQNKTNKQNPWIKCKWKMIVNVKHSFSGFLIHQVSHNFDLCSLWINFAVNVFLKIGEPPWGVRDCIQISLQILIEFKRIN